MLAAPSRAAHPREFEQGIVDWGLGVGTPVGISCSPRGDRPA
jgi:hypothetical protein